MKSTLSMTLFAGAATGVVGVTTQCSAGYVHKDNLSGLMCMTNVNNDASCNSECCKQDENTCGGINAKKAIVCPFNQYKASDDAWARTAATAENAVKVCCAAKSTCASATCPPGYKSDTKRSTMLCSGDAKSCAASLGATGCCIKDQNTCGGQTPLPCGAVTKGHFKAGATKEQDDSWKAIPFPAGSVYVDKCCTAYKTCAATGYTCPNGQKKKTPDTAVCKDEKDAGALDVKDCGRDGITKKNGKTPKANPCCEADVTTCYGAAHDPAGARTCTDATKYAPTENNGKKPTPLVAGKISADLYNKQCCTAKKATCKDATCPAGYTKKVGVNAVTCDTDAKSCKTATCCQPDTKTCAGQTAINCPYGFFSEQTTWTKDTAQSVQDSWNQKPANATNKNVNCCTPRAICDTTATTTPAITATPAAPALKYSANHKVATAASASTGNLVWLACGAIVGMSVMMIAQKLRSSSVREDVWEADDAEVLLATTVE